MLKKVVLGLLFVISGLVNAGEFHVGTSVQANSDVVSFNAGFVILRPDSLPTIVNRLASRRNIGVRNEFGAYLGLVNYNDTYFFQPKSEFFLRFGSKDIISVGIGGVYNFTDSYDKGFNYFINAGVGYRKYYLFYERFPSSSYSKNLIGVKCFF